MPQLTPWMSRGFKTYPSLYSFPYVIYVYTLWSVLSYTTQSVQAFLPTCCFHSVCYVTSLINLKETTIHRSSTGPGKLTLALLFLGLANTMRPFQDEAQKPLHSYHVSFLNGDQIVFSAYQQGGSKRLSNKHNALGRLEWAIYKGGKPATVQTLRLVLSV